MVASSSVCGAWGEMEGPKRLRWGAGTGENHPYQSTGVLSTGS